MATGRGVTLVTGASRGIGRAVALELARLGFEVVATMRNISDGVGLSEQAERDAGSLRVSRMDVTDPSTIEIPEGLTVLVNNAGVDGDYLPVEHAPIDQWRYVFETNVFGLLEVTSRAIPVLRSNGGGVICNTTSSSIYVPVPFYGVYRASKAAVGVMGESLAAEVSKFGIRVLDIAPGPIATDMLEASDRLPEGGRFAGYEELAEQMLEGRRSISSMVATTESAATAIGQAIVGEDHRLRQGCDPLGQSLLDAWRANPEQFLPS